MDDDDDDDDTYNHNASDWAAVRTEEEAAAVMTPLPTYPVASPQEKRSDEVKEPTIITTNSSSPPMARDPSATTASAAATHQQQQQQQQDHTEEAPVEQILRFWNHPALQQVSPAEKQDYLMNQKGMTKQQIYQAWDQLLLLTPTTPAVQPQQQQQLSSSSSLFQPQQQQQPHHSGTHPPYPPSPAGQQQQQPLQLPYSSSSYPFTNNTGTGMHAYNQQHPAPTSLPAQTSPALQQQQQQDEDDGPLSLFDGVGSHHHIALIAAIGGGLGLWAAAAVRWLNGGDFLVFPPPSRRDSSDMQQEKGVVLALQNNSNGNDNTSNTNNHEDTTTVEEDDDDEEGSQDDDGEEDYFEEEDDDPELAQYLTTTTSPTTTTNSPVSTDVLQHAMTQLAAFSETMQQHVSVQQRILQKLSSNSHSNNQSVTDLSMQGLRQKQPNQTTAINKISDTNNNNNNNTPTMMLWYKLVEIQVELGSLKRTFFQSEQKDDDKGSLELQARLGQTMVRLESVLKDMEQQHLQIVTAEHQSSTVEVTEEVGTAKEENAGAVANEEETGEPSSSSNPVKAERTAHAEDNANQDKTTLDMADKAPSSTNDRIEMCHNNDTTSQEDKSTPPADASSPTEKTEVDDSAQHLRDLRKAVIDLVRQNSDDPAALKAGTQVLFLYVSNLAKNPHLPRFRKVFTSNDSFQKFDRLSGGRDLLHAIGFVPSEDNRFLEWPPAEMEEDGTTPKTLTTQEKEGLVQTYHLTETAAALAILKSVPTKKNAKGNTEEATMSLVEKALEALPCPPPLVSEAQVSTSNTTENVDGTGNGPPPEDNETDARWK